MDKDPASTRIVVITGPESTGKTELAKALALHFNAEWMPELARNYVENLDRKYTYSDVEIIAQRQVQQFQKAIQSHKQYFFDTGLIITKVWFDVVFKKCPDWLIEAINSFPKFPYLLCDIDLPWEYDPVRENGGERRMQLFLQYQKELDYFGFAYRIVSGSGKARLSNAVNELKAIT